MLKTTVMKERPSFWLFAYVALIILAIVLRTAYLIEIPPTFFGDEAWFEVRGREVLRGINLLPNVDPVFQSGNSPFQIYATALVQALGHPAAYSARWVSATAGVVSVALVYPCLLIVLRDTLKTKPRHLAALTATAVMATLFAGVLLSRDGRQNTVCTAFTILTVMSLFHTLDRLSLRWAVLTGFLLAITQTTYEAALALPILVLAYIGLRAVLGPSQQRRRLLVVGGTVALSGLFFYGPFLFYYSQHPEIVLNKLQSVTALASIQSDPLDSFGRLINGYVRVWQGIVFEGDRLPTQNLPGRPLFDPFVSVLFLIGLLGALTQARRSPGIQLLLLWSAVMALPSAATVVPPAFTRSLPMTPALAALAGLGAGAILQMTQRWAAPAPRWGLAGLLGAGLCFSTANTVYDYLRYVQDPRILDAYHAYGRFTIEHALRLAQEGDVWLTPRSNPFLLYPFALTIDEEPNLVAFDASPDCLPKADRKSQPTTYGVITALDSDSLPLLKQSYSTGKEVAWVMHHDGYAYAVFFQVAPDTAAPTPTRPAQVDFDGGLQLTGFDLTSVARPGETLVLALYWRLTQPISEDITGFVHIGKGANSEPLIAQNDALICPGLPTSKWRPGYVYVERRRIAIEVTTAPDFYDVRLGAYHSKLGTRLPILAAERPIENNRVILAPLTVRD